MSSSLLKRFEASRESAPVESPLDKPASIHDDAGKVVAAVEPAVPATAESSSGPGLHAPGLPAEPVTKPVDATGVAKDESADKNVVAAVKPAVPSSSTASGLPAEPVKEAKSNAAAVADDKADAEGKTVAAVQSVTPHHANEALAIVMEARTAAALEWMMEDKHGVQISVPVRSQAHHGHLADYFDKLANDPAEKAKKNHDGIPGIHSEADMHRSMADYHRKLSKGIDPAKEDLDPEAAQVQPATCIVPMPDHAHETEAAYRAVEEAVLHHAVEELDRVQSGLEDLRERIGEANAAGGLSAESAFFASFAVESLLKRFDIEDQAIVGSFESAVVVPDGKTVVSTEALDATLEGVDNVFKDLGKRTVASLHRTVTNTWLGLQFAVARLNKVVAEARKLKGTSKAVDIRVPKRYVLIGNDVASNVGAAFGEAAEKLRFLCVDFSRQAKEDYLANEKAVYAAAKTAMADSIIRTKRGFNEDAKKLMGEIWSKWKDPRQKLGGNPTAPIIGNYVFFEDQSLKYKGDDPTAKKFDAFANLAWPTLISFQHQSTNKSGGPTTIPALSPKTIVEVAERLILAAQGIKLWRAMVEQTSSHPTMQVLAGLVKLNRRARGRDAGTYSGFDGRVEFHRDHEMSTVRDALNTSNRLRFHVGFDAGHALRDTIKHFVKIAKESLNAHAKASVEAFDQQNSLDGVSVNETAPNEPVQMPAAGHTATEKELMAKQDSWEDKPASFQTIEDEVGAEAIDFDGAVNACESLMDEAGEIAILSQHYATEAEASGEAKPHPGMVERIKAWVAKIGEFFRSVWKRIVAFVTQQGNRLMDWASRLRKHHFEKVTVKITGAQDAYINDMKLPNLSPFYEFMDEAAGAGETLATKLEAFNASGGYQGTSDGKTLDHRAKAIDANAAFMNIHTDTPIPAEGLVGAFKLSIEDGKLVETQVVKKIGEDREYTVTGSSLASFVEGAARLIKKAEARAKAFEMKSDADWKKAKVAADTLVSGNSGLFNLKPFGESARFLMKAFSVLQSWARAVGNFAEECIKGAGSKLRKNDRDDIVDAKFTPAAEARADLPYWYHPAEA